MIAIDEKAESNQMVEARAVIYARVSSATQRERETISSQMRDLPAFVVRQGWTLVRPAGTYVDDGFSAKAGKLAARTGLAALLRDAAAGVFDVVVVADVDRLTRAEDMGERGAIFGALQRAGVKIASANSGTISDPSTGEGDLMISLGGYFAAEWGRKHKSRILAGKLTAIAKGKKPAGPTPYGWDYSRESGVWSINEVEAAIIREIYARIAGGESCETVGTDLERREVPRPSGGRWCRRRILAIVHSDACCGTWTADKARGLTIPVPAIVTELEAERARAKLAAWGRSGRRDQRHFYLLSGLVRCRCGLPVWGQPPQDLANGSRTVARYVCQHRRAAPRRGPRCDAPTLITSEADEAVWATVTREIMDPALVEWVRRDIVATATERHAWRDDAAGHRRHLARLDRVEASILARYRRDQISEGALEIELAAIRRERAGVRDQVDTAERAQSSALTVESELEAAEQALADVRTVAEVASGAERRSILRLLMAPRSAVVDGHQIKLRLRVPTGAASLVASDLDGAGFGWRSGRNVNLGIREVTALAVVRRAA